MDTFFYNGHEYEVDLAALERSNNICYVWDRRFGWTCLKLAIEGCGLSVVTKASVNERSSDSLVAPHRDTASLELRLRERTTSNQEAIAVGQS
ncbi:MAG: hypothetical protein P1P90_01775 [Patescibacteria group bacterium]|nr:hypothetical protein [Patescibacteria group bacterium]